MTVLVTTHVLSGAVLGALIGRPVCSCLVGVASHFALDAIPHWGNSDEDVFLRVAVRDGLTGLTAIALAARLAPREQRLSVLAGMAGAALPDLDKPSRLFFGRSPFPASVDHFHGRIQREDSWRMPQEIIVATCLAAAAAVLLVHRRKRAVQATSEPTPEPAHLPRPDR